MLVLCLVLHTYIGVIRGAACICWCCIWCYIHILVLYTYIGVVYTYGSCIHIRISYGVASISRFLTITGFFCRIQSLLQGSFAKETYHFKEPTNRSHPISCGYAFVYVYNTNGNERSVLLWVYICYNKCLTKQNSTTVNKTKLNYCLLQQMSNKTKLNYCSTPHRVVNTNTTTNERCSLSALVFLSLLYSVLW